jgi:hypothetical protein
LAAALECHRRLHLLLFQLRLWLSQESTYPARPKTDTSSSSVERLPTCGGDYPVATAT